MAQPSARTNTPIHKSTPSRSQPMGISGRRRAIITPTTDIPRNTTASTRFASRDPKSTGTCVLKVNASGTRPETVRTWHSPPTDQASLLAVAVVTLAPRSQGTPWVERRRPSRPFLRWAQPQRGRGRLHRVADHREQVVPELGQVDLVAKPGAEGLKGAGRVVAPPVEPPVDERLDAPAGRAEQRRDDERRARDDHRVRRSREGTEPDRQPRVDASQHHREEDVNEGAVDDTVDVVQAVS